MDQWEEFSLPVSDGLGLVSYRWLPSNDPHALFLILHGMAEHAQRYREFARLLTEDGYAVYACDHRGHGKTGKKTGKLGFFAPQNGWLTVIDDIRHLIAQMRRDYPDKPLFVFGHSMGSFLARTCILSPELNFSGVILSGTSYENLTLMKISSVFAHALCYLHGSDKQSNLLHNLTFSSFNRPFQPALTPFDWLSRDAGQVKLYDQDPLCGFICTNAFYKDLFSGLAIINDHKSVANSLSKPPLLLLSGNRDPVGHFGKDLVLLGQMFKEAGYELVTYKLYPGARHEILHEINREDVYHDIFTWLNQVKERGIV